MAITASAASARQPTTVTADIQAGIEKHIEEQTRLGNGYFRITHGDSPGRSALDFGPSRASGSSDELSRAAEPGKELRLKLVRVHTEYLANLGPQRHFACVDLADLSGDVYDLDFFLSGDPGAMTVTETTIHKINGQPYYLWDQQKDGTWQRIPVERASESHLGVIRDHDSFEFRYWAKLPELTAPARLWLPLPETDVFQTVEVKSINVPGKQRILQEHKHGNRVLFLELGPQDSAKTLELRFQVQRREKAAYPAAAAEAEQYLNADQLIPATADFRATAREIVAGKRQPLVRARAIYDHVIERMRYMKFGEGFGKGDALYACQARTGNCTDFHSYFIALSRAAGIPARFAIGASIPSERNEGGIDGYHCWAEFYAEGKWWPVDISEGDKYSSLATYYFGHHPANRFELSRGRDLVVDPLPSSGPINFLAYPLLEVGGQPSEIKVAFSFVRQGE